MLPFKSDYTLKQRKSAPKSVHGFFKIIMPAAATCLVGFVYLGLLVKPLRTDGKRNKYQDQVVE
jgi:hypothetical protein